LTGSLTDSTTTGPPSAAHNRKTNTMASKKASPTWRLIDAVIGATDRVLLYGPPGTGKSYAASRAGLRDNQPVFIVTLTDETPAAELRGHYVPREGNFVWQDGPAISAWRAGGRLVVNEIQRASGDVLGLLLAITDDSSVAALTLPSGELVRPAPGFSIVGTMNGTPSDHLDEAIRSRFPVTVHVKDIHPEALAQLPADLRDAAVASMAAEENRRVTIRAWTAYATLRGPLGNDMAATAVFGKSAADVLSTLALKRAD